jgi:hypothetical protein
MKILYLTPWGYDYLPDQLYTGLCKVLGWESVIDFPWKPEYHDPACKVPYLPQNPGRRYEMEEIRALLNRNEFDLVVLTAQRRGTLEAFESLSQHCPLPPVAFVDSSDSPEMKPDLFRHVGGAVYFKREYHWRGTADVKDMYAKWRQFRSDRDLFSRTYPFQMSAILDTIPPLDGNTEDIDVSFNGYVSHRKRIRAVQLLKNAGDIRFEGGVYADAATRQSKLALGTLPILRAKLQGDPHVGEVEGTRKLDYVDHYRLLRRSKIGLSIRGSGFDTVRYWEIVASKTLLISEQPFICIPNNFEHGKHAIFCRPDLSDLLDLARTYLRDEATRKTIAEAGYQHLLKFHTCEQRARQFLDICQRKL